MIIPREMQIGGSALTSATVTRVWRRMASACAAVVFSASSALAEREDCAFDKLLIEGGFGTARFTIEVMDDNQERARGMMFRETLASSAGMLFVYEEARSVSFWMKNTLIPLDMIFTDARGVITRIHENAIPHDETPIFGGESVLTVLEINGGMSAKLGLEIGDTFKHPVFGEDAANPC